MASEVCVVASPAAEGALQNYLQNRLPLAPSPLLKLPLGSVRPHGWLQHQLALMTEGMTGRLGELSRFLAPSNGWLGGDRPGWEEQPYWFRGFYCLAALTGHPRLEAEAGRWIEAIIASQDADGYFGARYHKSAVARDGRVVCDLWPHMVMIDALISHRERSGDPRIVPLLSRFFAFCRELSEPRFIPPLDPEFGEAFCQYHRAGDMLPHL